MNDDSREFLTNLLETPSPSGYETRGQRVWIDYVSQFADEVRTDAYGNAVAVHEGASADDADAPEIALTGHVDEIGFLVKSIDDNGFVRPGRVGGTDPTVSQGQHVTIYASDGPVEGVIGQNAIHLREDESEADIEDLWIDIGAESEDAARERIEIGDPITFSSTVSWLSETRLAGRGLDNRVGTWAAAEGFRQAVETGTDATVYAVSTVQEEVGRKGAQMVGFDLEPDAVLVVDVGHAVDYPSAPSTKTSQMELGGGPALGRGSTNHPAVFDALRSIADERELELQVEALGRGTGTDADSFFTAAGAIPSQVVSVPNRYMHTPVELIDTDDLEEIATLLGAFASRADEFAPFEVDL
ncbi:peptidase M42 family protein [Natrialba magadii ATCC 43099]|uniref:Peptidase M42 family protein n=1 Tax=Natrialba magadii (strain ATCC 43099 / DSM 3394 / CCM 3739 / CIP 104546 / IAM 13178 / JCM 8861 / NBRC 102185 / NCIMB 2190 / MS3) TaxID=547559 RepID=D3SSW8_NATMM|nr:M20/M25/M40 family metallo-hydrolase [Natrialba magadii]ADD04914.1 peptidase M42 family protein [Natrialba magadii ATCC 43099]ELY23963.1 peptidase M42 family protein [Natrialba magadii ATCC 43099]